MRYGTIERGLMLVAAAAVVYLAVTAYVPTLKAVFEALAVAG